MSSDLEKRMVKWECSCGETLTAPMPGDYEGMVRWAAEYISEHGNCEVQPAILAMRKPAEQQPARQKRMVDQTARPGRWLNGKWVPDDR